MSSVVEDIISERSGGEGVEALILIKVDTAKADDIGATLAQLDPIQHVYLVTGEDDLVLKASFPTYRGLKDFIVKVLGSLDGVEDTRTMMIVTAYKEAGSIIEEAPES